MLLRQGYQQRGDALATKQHRHGNAQAAADLLNRMTAEEREVAASMGLTAEAFLAAKKEGI